MLIKEKLVDFSWRREVEKQLKGLRFKVVTNFKDLGFNVQIIRAIKTNETAVISDGCVRVPLGKHRRDYLTTKDCLCLAIDGECYYRKQGTILMYIPELGNDVSHLNELIDGIIFYKSKALSSKVAYDLNAKRKYVYSKILSSKPLVLERDNGDSYVYMVKDKLGWHESMEFKHKFSTSDLIGSKYVLNQLAKTYEWYTFRCEKGDLLRVKNDEGFNIFYDDVHPLKEGQAPKGFTHLGTRDGKWYLINLEDKICEVQIPGTDIEFVYENFYKVWDGEKIHLVRFQGDHMKICETLKGTDFIVGELNFNSRTGEFNRQLLVVHSEERPAIGTEEEE